jgi:hypothetical protein
MSRDDGRGSLSEWNRAMKDYLLGDVSIDIYKEEMKNIWICMGAELFEERLYDWEAHEPVRSDTVRSKQAAENEDGYTYIDRDWNPEVDDQILADQLVIWKKDKQEYIKAKRRAWPFIMSTLNKDMKTEVTAHDKFKALQMMGDTLGLWKLLATVEQGVCVNNFSMLMSKWVAMRYTPGTNVTRFFLSFESLVNQSDHAGGEHEMKMTDSTKCWQLTTVIFLT